MLFLTRTLFSDEFEADTASACRLMRTPEAKAGQRRIIMAAMDLTAFILAGGQSSRMGTDKALLQLEGSTLLGRSIALAKRLTPHVYILGAREKYGNFGVEVVEDEFPGCGPLGGIHAALGASQTALNLVLSVDTPFITEAFLRYLLDRAAAQPDALVTVPEAGGELQPACAVYRRPFRAVAEQQLKRGKNKVTATYPLVRVEYVEESEIRDAGFAPDIFTNLNTPQEYARAQGENGRR